MFYSTKRKIPLARQTSSIIIKGRADVFEVIVVRVVGAILLLVEEGDGLLLQETNFGCMRGEG